MPDIAIDTTNARAVAVAELFAGLEELLISYQFVPAAERGSRWATDADRITGEVSRHLAAARARLSRSFDPTTAAQR